MTGWRGTRLNRRQKTYRVDALDDLQVSLAMSGDKEAFSLLYRRWYPRLLRHAKGLVKHPEDARDVLQDAAIAIARNIHRLKNPKMFGPWAYTIVRNRAANHVKHLQRERLLKDAVRADNDLNNVPVPASSRADQLRELIHALSMPDQEVLSAYYVDGMSISEISECLALPSGTVKSRLFTARAHLKLAYQENEGKKS